MLEMLEKAPKTRKRERESGRRERKSKECAAKDGLAGATVAVGIVGCHKETQRNILNRALWRPTREGVSVRAQSNHGSTATSPANAPSPAPPSIPAQPGPRHLI